jgi:hypothetical protein
MLKPRHLSVAVSGFKKKLHFRLEIYYIIVVLLEMYLTITTPPRRGINVNGTVFDVDFDFNSPPWRGGAKRRGGCFQVE